MENTHDLQPLVPGRSDLSKDLFVGKIENPINVPPAPAPELKSESNWLKKIEPDSIRESKPVAVPEEEKSEVAFLREQVAQLQNSLTAMQGDIQRLREESFQKLDEAKRENEQLKQELATAKQVKNENPEEPALEELGTVAPVDTRNRLERIRDGVANGLRAWWDNIDPRKIGEKDRIWKVGLAIGVAEGVAVNLAPIPGGRFAINAINFLAGQGFYAVGEGLRQAEVVNTNKTFEGNEAIQRILDVNDRYINASRNIRNCLFGISAGITYTSVLGMGWDIAQHIVNPSLAAEALTGKATAAIGGHEVFNPVVTIPDHGNFWNAWHVDSTNWADLHNGTKHTDVIKDMVVKLARHNGHELGLVHAGDQIELGKVLNPEQLELVKKAAAAKSYAEYSQTIRPTYHLLLKR